MGKEILPGETLYFRQDKEQFQKSKKCLEFQCWNGIAGSGRYCPLHTKMHQDSVENMYRKLFCASGPDKWGVLAYKVRQASSHEDNHQLIQYDKLMSLLDECLGKTLSPE